MQNWGLGQVLIGVVSVLSGGLAVVKAFPTFRTLGLSWTLGHTVGTHREIAEGLPTFSTQRLLSHFSRMWHSKHPSQWQTHGTFLLGILGREGAESAFSQSALPHSWLLLTGITPVWGWRCQTRSWTFFPTSVIFVESLLPVTFKLHSENICDRNLSS